MWVIDSEVWKKLKDNNSTLLKLLKNIVSMELGQDFEWSNVSEYYGELQLEAKISLSNSFEKLLFVEEPIVHIRLIRYNPYETGLEEYVLLIVNIEYTCYKIAESRSKNVLNFKISPDEKIYKRVENGEWEEYLSLKI